MPLFVLIQSLISAGHSYQNILDFYTMGEIALFYRAITAQSKEALYDSAMAARLGQTTQESWRDFQNSVKASMNSLIKGSQKRGKAPVKRGDDALAGLFGQVLTDRNGKVASKTLGEIKNANS